MLGIVMPPDALFAARIADAGDHAGVVQLIRKDDAARQQAGQRGQRGIVGDVSAGEQQRGFLAVQVRQLFLQLDVVMRVATDVAGAARTGADIVQRFFHRRDHLGVLAHGEIIVAAPHGDRLGAVVPGKAARVGIGALVAQDIDEHPIAAFGVQPVDRLVEDLVVVQRLCPAAVRCGIAPLFRGGFSQLRVQLKALSLRTIRIKVAGFGGFRKARER